MNRHLLHPTLLHGLLQRMAGYRHLYAMRANRLDIVLVFPRHQRKNLRAQKQKGTQRIKDDDKAKKKNPKVACCSRACPYWMFYQSLFISRRLRGRDGSLADGLADGLSFKLWTRRLSVPVLVPLSFQPVSLNLNVSLQKTGRQT